MTSSTLVLTDEKIRLTPYREGSVRELWHISLPLIFTFLSSSLMLFVDRLCLAHYSTPDLNGAVAGGSWFWPFQYGTIAVASIAEVFVGQYNGAGRRAKLAEPVWQMIWFSLLSIIVFLPALIGISFVVSQENSTDAASVSYFRSLMYFGPCFPLATALAAFFIGQGKLGLIATTTLFGNMVNVVLDCVLIFGIDGVIAPMGVVGAAVATGIAQLLQCVILFRVFFNRNNRESCGSGNWRPQPKAFWSCLRIGVPNSLAHIVEIFAWIAYFRIMIAAGPDHITVAAVANTILCLFYFVSGGISKGVETIAANMIGSKQSEKIGDLIKSALSLHLGITGCLALLFLFFPSQLIDLFLPGGTAVSPEVRSAVLRSCVWVWIFYLFDGILWIFGSVLTASGDTKYIMVTSGVTAWLFAIVPSYYFILSMGYGADIGAFFTAVYSLLTAILFYRRVAISKRNKLVVAM